MLMTLKLPHDDPLASTLRELKGKVAAGQPAAALPAGKPRPEVRDCQDLEEGELLYAFDRAAEYSFQAAYPLKSSVTGAP